jgi:hypothetical protein
MGPSANINKPSFPQCLHRPRTYKALPSNVCFLLHRRSSIIIHALEAGYRADAIESIAKSAVQAGDIRQGLPPSSPKTSQQTRRHPQRRPFNQAELPPTRVRSSCYGRASCPRVLMCAKKLATWRTGWMSQNGYSTTGTRRPKYLEYLSSHLSRRISIGLTLWRKQDTLGETCVHIATSNGNVDLLELYLSQYPYAAGVRQTSCTIC